MNGKEGDGGSSRDGGNSKAMLHTCGIVAEEFNRRTSYDAALQRGIIKPTPGRLMIGRDANCRCGMRRQTIPCGHVMHERVCHECLDYGELIPTDRRLSPLTDAYRQGLSPVAQPDTQQRMRRPQQRRKKQRQQQQQRGRRREQLLRLQALKQTGDLAECVQCCRLLVAQTADADNPNACGHTN